MVIETPFPLDEKCRALFFFLPDSGEVSFVTSPIFSSLFFTKLSEQMGAAFLSLLTLPSPPT